MSLDTTIEPKYQPHTFQKTPIDLDANRLYRCATHAILRGDKSLAHRLLLTLAHLHPDQSFYWSLLGWTVESPYASRAYFIRALKANPLDISAQQGLDWADRGCVGYEPDISFQEISGLDETIGKYASSQQAIADGPTALANPLLTTLPISISLLALIYLAGITLAETITTIYAPVFGLVLHSILFLVLIINGALFATGEGQKMFWVLSIAPLIRIESLSIPFADYQTYTWFAIVGAPLFLAALIVYLETKKEPFPALQTWPRLIYLRLFPNKWIPTLEGIDRAALQVIIGLLGIGLGYIEFLILRPQPIVNQLDFGNILVPALILIIFTGLLEEVIFRGMMQSVFMSCLGKYRGLFYMASLFAVLHIGNHSWADVLFVFIVALIFGIVVWRTRSLVGVTIAHGLTNITLFLVLPFLIR